MTAVRGLCKSTAAYEGRPCRKCNGTLRYKSTLGCVACAQSLARESYRQFPTEVTARKRQKYITHNDNHRDLVLRRNYGISLADYNGLLDKQHGACAVCKNPCPSGRRLCVDHDHATRKVRGLLCVQCNRGIGNFKDNPMLLVEAASYLGHAHG